MSAVLYREFQKIHGDLKKLSTDFFNKTFKINQTLIEFDGIVCFDTTHFFWNSLYNGLKMLILLFFRPPLIQCLEGVWASS